MLSAKIANEHSGLLLHDIAQDLFQEQFYHISPGSTLGSRFAHILAVLAFSQGDLQEAEQLWRWFNASDLVSKRSLGAQVIMGGQEALGVELMLNYTRLLGQRFESVVGVGVGLGAATNSDASSSSSSSSSSSHKGHPPPERSPSTEASEEQLLDLLLSEAQGGIRLTSKLADLSLSVSDLRPLDSRQRFRLGVGLAKLGLFDLSLRHVTLSATPWEAPLYLLRARLVFPPVHASVRALALAVERFESQGEAILLHRTPRSPLMGPVCNSPNEAALALQALPLLHLAGFSAPRVTPDTLGHSPVALPVLLSEVFSSMCPPQPVPPGVYPSEAAAEQAEADSALQRPAQGSPPSHQQSEEGRSSSSSSSSSISISISGEEEDSEEDEEDEDEYGPRSEGEGYLPRQPRGLLRVGIVSGSFDHLPGRIVVGLLESMSPDFRRRLLLLAMCFPTPRDAMTDRASTVFDRHINLSALNKTEVVERVLLAAPHVILFADAALDSRVFALAHERLARFQGAIWGHGASVGVPTIDFHIAPEALYASSHGARCPVVVPGGARVVGSVEAQTLFQEQVVLLAGPPPLGEASLPPRASHKELWRVLQERYLLPPENRTHLYLFPASVRHLHPEFDGALAVLLRTDPFALVVLAVPRAGRDALPTVHIAVRHDLMHPTMPAAGVSKLRRRLRGSLGELAARVRVLPPLDDRIFRALRLSSVAVLDPFPVGAHVQVYDAFIDGVPVVSAPALQECTAAHAQGLAHLLGVPFGRRSPAGAEAAPFSSTSSPARAGAKGGGAGAAVTDDLDRDAHSELLEQAEQWPATREEYAVLALRLQREALLRSKLTPAPREGPEEGRGYGDEDGTHGDQVAAFLLRLYGR